MTIHRLAILVFFTGLIAAPPAAAGQLVAASLKNGGYGTGTAVPPTTGVLNTPDGVVYLPTEVSGRSNALVNWQIGNNPQFRLTGTIAFLFKATRGALAPGEILGDNYGFGMFNNGQGAFSASAGIALHGAGTEDDRVVISWKSWHAGTWYSHSSTEIEFDKWYSLGFAWGGPFEFEIWVNQARMSAVNIAGAFPWGLASPPSGYNMGLGDNHERGIDPYNSAAGVTFADVRMWNEYRALGDTVDPTHAPTTGDDNYATDEDVAITRPAPGVLGNDTDQDGDSLTAAVASTPLNGTLDLQSNGSFTYQPNPGFHGTDTFTYEASDGSKQSTGTVTIAIASINDAPVANDDQATTAEDTAVTILALANDTDPDGDALQITQAFTSIGAVAFDGSGIAFTPPPDYSGTVSITYTISDGQGGTAEGSVTVTVTAAPPPALSFDSIANAINGLAELNHGQRTSLLARLVNAQRASANGHIAVAISDLLQLANSLARFSQSAEATQTVSDIRTLAASLL